VFQLVKGVAAHRDGVRVLQHVAVCVEVCCSVLQRVTACCSVEDGAAYRDGVRVLQRVAACCSVLQCVAVYVAV